VIEIKHGQISDAMFYNYLSLLIDKIFKILPMKEKNISTLYVYLDSLQIEILGCMGLSIEFKNDPEFITLLSTIQYLCNSTSDDKTYKREVFKMIKIIEKLQGKYLIKEVDI
jgi:hypothetical protein